MRELFRRIGYLLNRSRLERELESEMAFHREMAARHGGERFGNTLRLREEARDAWGWTWLDRLGQDLRYAARTLRRSPGFTLAAVATLAIGIGVNITAFGFLNLVVLKPLPVRDPDTLLRFERRAADRFATDLPYPQAAFIREHSRTLIGSPGDAPRAPADRRRTDAAERALRDRQFLLPSLAQGRDSAGCWCPASTARPPNRWRCSATSSGSGASARTRRWQERRWS